MSCAVSFSRSCWHYMILILYSAQFNPRFWHETHFDLWIIVEQIGEMKISFPSGRPVSRFWFFQMSPSVSAGNNNMIYIEKSRNFLFGRGISKISSRFVPTRYVRRQKCNPPSINIRFEVNWDSISKNCVTLSSQDLMIILIRTAPNQYMDKISVKPLPLLMVGCLS
jgi:hypothetical protein